MEEAIIVLFCLVLNALFSAYEMAFVSVSKPELKSLARKGNIEAQKLLLLREHPERTLSIIQVGITLVGAIAAAVGGAGAAESLEPYLVNQVGLHDLTAEILAVVTIVLPITYLSVVIGELVPKTLALRNPTKIVLAGAKWLKLADRTLAPIVQILESSTKWILTTFFKKSHSQESPSQTTLEIDTFSPVHQRFILNMADIEKKRIRDIMLPWSQVNFVKHTDAMEDVTQVVLSSGHTRLPVVDETQVLGILHTKEFVALKESGERNWQSIIRTALSIRPTDSAFGVMRLMQDKRSHMALVCSEQKETLGIVTLEDILEEVVGDIFDEDDDGRVRKVFASKIKSRVLPSEK